MIWRIWIFPKTLSLYWGIFSTTKKHIHWHVQACHHQFHYICDDRDKPTKMNTNHSYLPHTQVWRLWPLHLKRTDSGSNIFKGFISLIPFNQVWVPLCFNYNHNKIKNHKILLYHNPGVIIWHHNHQFEGNCAVHIQNVHSIQQPTLHELLLEVIYNIPRCPDLIRWPKGYFKSLFKEYTLVIDED